MAFVVKSISKGFLIQFKGISKYVSFKILLNEILTAVSPVWKLRLLVKHSTDAGK